MLKETCVADESCAGGDATGASKSVVVSHRETEKARERKREK